MFVRWKQKYGKKFDRYNDIYETYTAELYQSVRTGKKVQQKYVAYLGGIGCFAYNEEEGELDRLVFWSKAWRKLYDLGIAGDELQRIEDSLSRKLPKPNMCVLLRPRQRKIKEDERQIFYFLIGDNLTWTPEVKGTLWERMSVGNLKPFEGYTK
jgi:hypothetical protein